MFVDIVSIFVDMFVMVFTVLLVIRVISSYFAQPGGKFFTSLVALTEPVIAPVRRVLPQTPGLDLAPLVAYVLLRVVQYVVHMVLGS